MVVCVGLVEFFLLEIYSRQEELFGIDLLWCLLYLFLEPYTI